MTYNLKETKVIFIFPLRLSTNLETKIEATVFPIIAAIPMYPMILSLSSGAPRGRGSKVTFIIENQDATKNRIDKIKSMF